MDSLVSRVTYTRCRINTIDSFDDEHMGARNMQWIGINIGSFSSLSYDRSKASSKASCPHSAIQSFLFQIRVSLLSLRSFNSFLRLLPCLPVTSIPLCIFPSVTRCRRQFLRKMWPIQFAFHIYEKRIVRQVGYLQEMNRDARSTKHKKLQPVFFIYCERSNFISMYNSKQINIFLYFNLSFL
jgi:hypothetical protein